MIFIIEHCKRVEEKIAGATRQTLDENKDIEEIVCFNLLQIGELAKALEPDFFERYGGVDWKGIKGMRDQVAHGYGTIDLELIWKSASEEVKPLREYCESILKSNR